MTRPGHESYSAALSACLVLAELRCTSLPDHVRRTARLQLLCSRSRVRWLSRCSMMICARAGLPACIRLALKPSRACWSWSAHLHEQHSCLLATKPSQEAQFGEMRRHGHDKRSRSLSIMKPARRHLPNSCLSASSSPACRVRSRRSVCRLSCRACTCPSKSLTFACGTWSTRALRGWPDKTLRTEAKRRP